MQPPGPRLRFAALCGRIQPDIDGLPFALERPVHTLRFPLGQSRDYRPRELSLYVQLENATGSYHFWPGLRNEHGETINPNAKLEWVTFPQVESSVVPIEREFKLDVVFPAPGVYFIHLMCEARSLHEPWSSDDRPFPPARVVLLPSGEV